MPHPHLYTARVAAVGSEEDMIRLCRSLLSNCDWLEDQDEDLPPLKLPELLEQIAHHSAQEGGQNCEFLYGMVAHHVYGEAQDDSCRFAIRQEPCGLWTARFCYDGETPCQTEDWLRLHNQCGRVPMLILRAGWDFSRDKGMLILTGGHVQEDWNRMGEIWLWLIEAYECGYPPEEAVRRLEKLEKTLEREDFDQSITEILQGCIDNLHDLTDHLSDSEFLRKMLAECREKQDWEGLFVLQCRVAETVLWETEHHARWLANLEAVLEAWENR